MNSLAFRLIGCMIVPPTIGWWWTGQCFVPLLPVSGAAAPREPRAEASTAESAGPGDALPATTITIPRCKWLRVAREEWGEQTARAKCLIE